MARAASSVKKQKAPKDPKSTATKSSASGSTKQTKKESLQITFSKKKLLLIITPLLLSVLVVLGYKNRGELIIATVNGKPITRMRLWKDLEQQGGTQSLEALITQELITQEGAKQNIAITQQEIDTELQNIEKIVSAQGLTIEQALEQQRITKKQLVEQIKLQKTLERLVGESVAVTENELDKTLAQALESGQEDSPELREQIRTQLEQTKLSQAVQEYLASIKQGAEINILNSDFKDVAQYLN